MTMHRKGDTADPNKPTTYNDPNHNVNVPDGACFLLRPLFTIMPIFGMITDEFPFILIWFSKDLLQSNVYKTDKA